MSLEESKQGTEVFQLRSRQSARPQAFKLSSRASESPIYLIQLGTSPQEVDRPDKTLQHAEDLPVLVSTSLVQNRLGARFIKIIRSVTYGWDFQGKAFHLRNYATRGKKLVAVL